MPVQKHLEHGSFDQPQYLFGKVFFPPLGCLLFCLSMSRCLCCCYSVVYQWREWLILDALRTSFSTLFYVNFFPIDSLILDSVFFLSPSFSTSFDECREAGSTRHVVALRKQANINKP